MQRRSLIFVVISVLVVGLVYSSFSSYVVVAEPMDPRFDGGGNCTDSELRDGALERTCCWREPIPGSILGKKYCQTCTLKTDRTSDCKPKEPQSATPEMPTFETKPLPSGDVPTLEPSEPVLPQIDPQGAPPIMEQQPPLEQNQGLLPEESITEQQPADQGAPVPPTTEDGTGQPPTEILCIEGFELDEDTNLCVPTESQITEEPQEAAEPEEQQQTEEQPSEEPDTEGDNDNN